MARAIGPRTPTDTAGNIYPARPNNNSLQDFFLVFQWCEQELRVTCIRAHRRPYQLYSPTTCFSSHVYPHKRLDSNTCPHGAGCRHHICGSPIGYISIALTWTWLRFLTLRPQVRSGGSVMPLSPPSGWRRRRFGSSNGNTNTTLVLRRRPTLRRYLAYHSPTS